MCKYKITVWFGTKLRQHYNDQQYTKELCNKDKEINELNKFREIFM